MKGMKGKLLKKLTSIRPIHYLKHDRVLQVKASDGYLQSFAKDSAFTPHTQNFPQENEPRKIVLQGGVQVQEEPVIIDVSELMRDLEDQEIDFDDNDEDPDDDKENIGPLKHQTEKATEADVKSRKVRTLEATPLADIEVMSFRRPELNSESLFDPNLLVAFELAAKELREAERRRSRVQEEVACQRINIEEEPPWKSRRIEIEEELENPLMLFEEKCPPSGSDCVVFYTTTLRGIRKTFEDCNSIRFLLDSFRVRYFERDISMHKEFKEELYNTLGEKTLPPKLFIKGRYIGGAEQVLSLHEQGKLRPIFEGMRTIEDRSNGPSCEACFGIRFVVCFNCHGSHKVIAQNGEKIQCQHCNENGLIICPYCC